MTLRVGYAASTEITIGAGIDLDDATLLKIVGTKPSGTAIDWTAARSGTTDNITYTTTAGDLDEVGTYLIRAYIEWGSSVPRYGDITELIVDALNERVTINEVVKYVNALTFLSCQTEAEATAGTNTDADLLFMDQSFNQGNFYIFYGMASGQLSRDIVQYTLTLDYIQELSALAYLIQHYWEMKFKDWDAKELSINNDKVVKGVAGLTSGMAAYNKLIAEIIRAGSSSVVDTGIVKHADDTHYPSEFKDVPFDDVEMDVI
jgi:hypothetical protein